MLDPAAARPPAAPAALGPLPAQALLDLPVGIGLYDMHGERVHANRALLHAERVALGDLLAGPVGSVLASGRPVLGLAASGGDQHFSVDWYPVPGPDGAPQAVTVLVTDVTALARARRAAAGSDTALRSVLLPEGVLGSDELEVVARQLPGGDDWYDVVELGAGRLGVAVGNVGGAPADAAGLAAAGQLRAAVRTCARLELAPHEVLSVLDRLVADLPTRPEATCAYAVFDPHGRAVQVSGAAAPAPVLRSGSGGVQVLAAEPSAALGSGEPVRQRTIALPAGSVLALCTPALLADAAPDAGVLALAGALLQGPHGLDALADAVLAALPGAAPGAVLLLLRVPVDADSRSSSLVVPVPRERTRLGQVRTTARSAMRRWALLAEVAESAVLLADELATNGLVHGRGDVELRLRLTRDRLVVEVADQGRHLPRRRWTSRDDERGRGLHVVAALAARWGFRLTDGGKVVWAELDLAAPDDASPETDHDVTRS